MIWLQSHVHWISLPKASQVAAVKGKKVSEYKPQYFKALYFKGAGGWGWKGMKERRRDEKDKEKKENPASPSNWMNSTIWE